MRTYWDSSALINAAVSEAVMDRLDPGEHVSRLHTLAEFFSIMTSRGILIQSRDPGALDKAEELSVQGGRIYDYWHALVARKAKADTLLTRNTEHFTDYADNVTWPWNTFPDSFSRLSRFQDNKKLPSGKGWTASLSA